MRIRWRRISASAAVLAAAGLFVAWAGIVDIRASTGHWRVTDWFLHWVMRASVRTAALGGHAPRFTAAMLPLAAGHYETGCAGCHGSPAMPRPATVENMLPPPPNLQHVNATWNDAELFEIVKHGVRYTGMPAWPSLERDDEVWAMVAFLREYPSLDQATYQRLAGFSAAASRDFATIVKSCEGCHSSAGPDETSLIPRLTGQSETYLRDSLEAYATGKRPSGVMKVALSQTSSEDRKKLASYFASQSVPTETDRPSGMLSRGKVLAERGDRTRGIAACAACHDAAGVNEAYPRLAGQPVPYLENQLGLFRSGTRGGGAYAGVMTRAAAGLTDDDIQALAAYYSALSKD
ncbi:c-type cytochrome [Rhizobium laguerreae]|uniref:c-type cytochrome n=1 Tax=Rhizobium laguerreae TaxID=1076926 RepID=UPI001C904E0E|nr:c-type cytochrome [Rhizobium laguerreae]MBY3351573.1 c-type cytochrome [Rhizobium laguerreae]MBY3450565.1 c-type cytochrome [Rhizobium laguerreae]MBY3457733.1 c-type cytochrome [Rhizobium laguerreae]